MAVRNMQPRYIQQSATSPKPQIPNNKRPQKVKSRTIISKQEKFLYLFFLIALATVAVSILYTQSKIQTAAIAMTQMEVQISEVKKENEGLKIKVDELSSYERILKKAKESGLTLDEKNIKVVPGE